MQRIMRIDGKPLHRVTVWRRLKRGNDFSGLGRRDHGPELESFARFTAAVIDLFNENGFCDYGAIWDASNTEDPFHYRQFDADLYETIVSSGYPPAMLAVAACKLIPLNLKTRGGPRYEITRDAQAQAVGAIRQSGGRLDTEALAREQRKKRFLAGLKVAGIEDAQTFLAEYLRDPSALWVNEYVKAVNSPDDDYFDGTAPVRETSQGTPAYRVDFVGVKLSRRMASYWLHHADFKACLLFLEGLLEHERPTAPYQRPVTLPREINVQFKRYLKIRHEQRKQSG